jgi:hypothetical protein
MAKQLPGLLRRNRVCRLHLEWLEDRRVLSNGPLLGLQPIAPLAGHGPHLPSIGITSYIQPTVHGTVIAMPSTPVLAQSSTTIVMPSTPVLAQSSTTIAMPSTPVLVQSSTTIVMPSTPVLAQSSATQNTPLALSANTQNLNIPAAISLPVTVSGGNIAPANQAVVPSSNSGNQVGSPPANANQLDVVSSPAQGAGLAVAPASTNSLETGALAMAWAKLASHVQATPVGTIAADIVIRHESSGEGPTGSNASQGKPNTAELNGSALYWLLEESLRPGRTGPDRGPLDDFWTLTDLGMHSGKFWDELPALVPGEVEVFQQHGGGTGRRSEPGWAGFWDQTEVETGTGRWRLDLGGLDQGRETGAGTAHALLGQPAALASFIPEDTRQAGLCDFLSELDELSRELAKTLERSGLLSWLVALFTTAAACEILRRRLRSSQRALALAGPPGGSTLTWATGLPGSFSTEDE